MLKKTMVVLAIGWMLSGVTYADGPAGIKMGQKMVSGEKSQTGFLVDDIPSENLPGGFTGWYYGTRRQGACVVRMYSLHDDIDWLSPGYLVRQRVDDVAEQLARKYGLHTDKYDYVVLGSLYDSQKEWSQALARDERKYSYYWVQLKEHPSKVRNISLVPSFFKRDLAMTVTYEFENSDSCHKEVESEKQSKF